MAIITCPECKTRYRVEEGDIGKKGREVVCHKCSHTWFQAPVIEKSLSRSDDDLLDNSAPHSSQQPQSFGRHMPQSVAGESFYGMINNSLTSGGIIGDDVADDIKSLSMGMREGQHGASAVVPSDGDDSDDYAAIDDDLFFDDDAWDSLGHSDEAQDDGLVSGASDVHHHDENDNSDYDSPKNDDNSYGEDHGDFDDEDDSYSESDSAISESIDEDDHVGGFARDSSVEDDTHGDTGDSVDRNDENFYDIHHDEEDEGHSDDEAESEDGGLWDWVAEKSPVVAKILKFLTLLSPIPLFVGLLYMFSVFFMENLPISGFADIRGSGIAGLTLENFILQTEVGNDSFDLTVSGMIANNSKTKELNLPPSYTVTIVTDKGKKIRYLQNTSYLHKKIAPMGYVGVSSVLRALPMGTTEVVIDIGDSRRLFCSR